MVQCLSAPTPETEKSSMRTGLAKGCSGWGTRAGTDVSTTSLTSASYGVKSFGENVTVKALTESGSNTPSGGSTANIPPSLGCSHTNGTGTIVAFLTVNVLVLTDPGTTLPKYTGPCVSSPGMVARASISVSPTSSTVPLPVTVNVCTWLLSHTILNCCMKLPGPGGAKPIRSCSTSSGASSMYPGPILNGATPMHGTGSGSLSSPRESMASSLGNVSGVVCSGQSASSTSRNLPSPPTFLKGMRVSTSLPTRTYPTSRDWSNVRHGGCRLAEHSTLNLLVSVMTVTKSS